VCLIKIGKIAVIDDAFSVAVSEEVWHIEHRPALRLEQSASFSKWFPKDV
jgi:hypothetical protein